MPTTTRSWIRHKFSKVSLQWLFAVLKVSIHWLDAGHKVSIQWLYAVHMALCSTCAVWLYVYMYIYTYIYIYKHTYIHTYFYVYVKCVWLVLIFQSVWIKVDDCILRNSQSQVSIYINIHFTTAPLVNHYALGFCSQLLKLSRHHTLSVANSL